SGRGITPAPAINLQLFVPCRHVPPFNSFANPRQAFAKIVADAEPTGQAHRAFVVIFVLKSSSWYGDKADSVPVQYCGSLSLRGRCWLNLTWDSLPSACKSRLTVHRALSCATHDHSSVV